MTSPGMPVGPSTVARAGNSPGAAQVAIRRALYTTPRATTRNRTEHLPLTKRALCLVSFGGVGGGPETRTLKGYEPVLRFEGSCFPFAYPPMVGVPGFEPGASSSRTMRASKLRHTPLEPSPRLISPGPRVSNPRAVPRGTIPTERWSCVGGPRTPDLLGNNQALLPTELLRNGTRTRLRTRNTRIRTSRVARYTILVLSAPAGARTPNDLAKNETCCR